MHKEQRAPPLLVLGRVVLGRLVLGLMAPRRVALRSLPPHRTARRGRLVVCAVVNLVVIATWGAAQQTVADPRGGTPVGAQTLNCLVDEALPNPPATAAAGGFSFFFQSLAGTATDGRACTVHRVMNAPGSPPTPVRWRAGDEPLIDMARLGRCSEESPCEWFAVARYFAGGFDHAATLLGFGLNADAFEVGTQSLLAVTDPDLGALTASVGTEVAGTVVTAAGRSIDVSFTVKSRLVRGDGAAMSLIYEVVTTTPELGPGGELALVWQVFDLVPAAAAVIRGDADAPFLSSELARAEGGTVVVGPDSYGVHVAVEALEYTPDLTLGLVERSNPAETLLLVPMPAFLPAR